MRFLASLLLVSVAFADLKSNGRSVDSIDMWSDAGYTGVVGDTSQFLAWTGSGNSGNFNGGRVYGSTNDATGWCAGSGNLQFLELTRLDFSTKSNTAITCVNGMTGYGSASQTNFPVGWADGNSWKSYAPFAYNGDLFWFVYRQGLGPFNGYQSTIITSPDKGIGWCNTETYASFSGCTSAHYSLTGDTPASNTHMAFGVAGSTNNPLARPINVQFCQDQTCMGMPFDADNYLYFVTMDGHVPSRLFAACVAKSKPSLMDPTQWWYWKAGNATCSDTGSWTHTASQAVQIQLWGAQAEAAGANPYGYPSGVMYISQAGQFLMTSYDGSSNQTMLLTSQYPWGPYKRTVFSPETGHGSFVSGNLAFLDSSCSGCNTNPGRWNMTVAASIYSHSASGSFAFFKLPLANGGPSIPNTAPAGKNLLGRLPLKISKDGVNKSLIGRGLQNVFLFDDYIDYASGDFAAYANMYARDALGSSTCLAGASSPSGTLSFGQQTPTTPLAFTASGLTLGGQYLGQLNSQGGNCTGAVPLSGNPDYTVIVVLKPDRTNNGNTPYAIWEMFDDSVGLVADRALIFGVNAGFETGTNIIFRDYDGKIKVTPTWDTSHYWMFTLTKTAGAMSVTNTKIYLGSALQASTLTTTPSSVPNLPTNMKILLNCTAFAGTGCNNGGSANSLGASYAVFVLYNRALSAEEVNRNYIAIKAALAQAPRSITLQ